MHANRHTLALFGTLGAVFFAAAPASAQCTDEWLPGEGLPGLNGDVFATAVYDDGTGPSLFVGGEFWVAGNVAANNIARWDGTQWQPLGSGINEPVLALTVYNGELIAGGEFNTAGGTATSRIARWDGESWSPLGSGTNNDVRALTVTAATESSSELIAGGYFTTAGGTQASKIARWDGESWSPLGSGLSSSPKALTEYNGELIAGGSFSTAGGMPVSRIARWDGTNWSPLGSGMDSGVFALTVYGGELIAAGDFETAGETPASRIARWDGTSWSTLGQGLNSWAWGVTVYNGELIAGGGFGYAGGTQAEKIARWDGENWSPLGSGFNLKVLVVSVYDGKLFAGGEFGTAGETSVNGIARWDSKQWSPLGGGMDGSVRALTVYNGEMIASGSFNIAGGTPFNKIASWDGANWSSLGGGMQGCEAKSCSASLVHALTIYNGELIAGGNFLAAGGTLANHVARWDGATWSPLGSGMGGGYYYPTVLALTEYNGELIAAGHFTSAGGRPANYIARWDGASWSTLGNGLTGWYHDSPPYVSALAVYKGELIAGGYFTTAGGSTAYSIARWDGTSWSSPPSFSMSAKNNDEPRVRSLTVHNGELIAGGQFNGAGGTEADSIARWDGESWSPLGSGMNGTVYSLTVFNGELIAGGQFTTAGGMAANRIARWDGTDWSTLGSGMMGGGNSPRVYDLTEYNGELIAGGSFTSAGGEASSYWARWGSDAPPGDLDGDCSVGSTDLLILLANWGPCADCDDCPADIDGNCTVGASDLLILLANWAPARK